MKFRSTVLATALAFAALAVTAQASASCSYPKAPDKIPDGTKATKEEMLAGMKIMRAYTALEAFGLIAQRVALDERCSDTYPLQQEHKAEQAMRAWARQSTLPDRNQAVATYGRYKAILSREVQACWKAP